MVATCTAAFICVASNAGPKIDSRTNVNVRCRIAEQEPYFALSALWLDGCELRARVPVQTDPGREVGTIGAAEAARHLASLGSCAAALLAPDDTTRYYLARSARFRRVGQPPRNKDLQGTATAVLKGTRAAAARVELETKTGGAIASLDVQYNILRKATFERLHSHLEASLPLQDRQQTKEQNPFARPPLIDVQTINAKGTSLKAHLGPVTLSHCAGHFTGYPALPAVVIFKALVVSCAHLLERAVQAPGCRYTVWQGALAAVGEDVLIEAGIIENWGDVFRFKAYAVASSDGRGIGSGTFVLALPHETPRL